MQSPGFQLKRVGLPVLVIFAVLVVIIVVILLVNERRLGVEKANATGVTSTPLSRLTTTKERQATTAVTDGPTVVSGNDTASTGTNETGPAPPAAPVRHGQGTNDSLIFLLR